MQTIYQDIAAKVSRGERLSRQDGLSLLACDDLTWLGHLADIACQRVSGNTVVYSVTRAINLTNICVAKCNCCTAGCDETSPEAFFLTKENVLDIARQASRDAGLRELHISSGLHPHWGLGYYRDILQSLKEALPQIHLKAFSTAEVYHLVQITSQPAETVLRTLRQAGLDSLLGDRTELLSDRVRADRCQRRAVSAQWLDMIRTAHRLGIPSDAAMLYGHLETPEERVDHLLALRSLQDETGGFQTFVPVPFQPHGIQLEHPAEKTSAWEDLKTLAVSRLLLDNFQYIKVEWSLLTLPVGQLALGFGANYIDGAMLEQRTSHAGSQASQYLGQDTLITVIRQTGRVPAQLDPVYNVVQKRG
ncbi:MAG: CofH family radical SAM protein [Negativicutes bacterium]|nr:CofH family radical SAM protein [Negativicutes bacterium]